MTDPVFILIGSILILGLSTRLYFLNAECESEREEKRKLFHIVKKGWTYRGSTAISGDAFTAPDDPNIAGDLEWAYKRQVMFDDLEMYKLPLEVLQNVQHVDLGIEPGERLPHQWQH